MERGKIKINSSEGTVNGLIDFMHEMQVKRRIKDTTIRPLILATKAVFRCKNNHELLDEKIEKINLEEVFRNFKKEKKQSCNKASQYAYESRVKRAFSMYKRYLSDDEAFLEEIERNSYGDMENRTNKSAVFYEYILETARNQIMHSVSSPNISVYPFPCETGEAALLCIPKRFSKKDAALIGSFLQTLANYYNEKGGKM